MITNMNDLLEAVGLQEERSAAAAATISGNYEKIQQIGEAKAAATIAAGENDAIVVDQKGVGLFKAQENARAYATALGSNMDSSSEIMTSLGMQLREANMQAIKAKDVVAKKQSVSLLDDPLQYIINQITVGDDINAADAAQSKADTIAQSLANINASTTATAQSQNAIAATDSAKSVQAAAQSVRDKSAIQAAEIAQQNLVFNVNGLEKVNAMGQQQLSNMFSAKGAINAEKQLELSQASLELSRANHAIALEERMERINTKKAADQEIIEMGNTINAGRSILGLPPIPPGKAVQMMKIGGELGDSIKDQYTKGAVAESTGVRVIDNNPGRAAVTIAKSQAPLAPAMAPVKNLLMETLADVAQGRVKGANGLPADPKNAGSITAATDTNVKLRAKQMAGNIKTGDANNIYAAPTYQSLIKIAPGVTETELYQKVLAPLVNTGLTDVNPEQVLTLSTQAIARGELSFMTATRDIKTLFSGIAATNNVTKDYARVGLQPQRNFNTAVTIRNANTPNIIAFTTSQNVKVDLIDSAQISSVLSKYLAASREGKFSSLYESKQDYVNRLKQQ